MQLSDERSFVGAEGKLVRLLASFIWLIHMKLL